MRMPWWLRRPVAGALAAFDRGEMSERCLAWELALRTLDYLELRDLKRWESR